ncbi:hypothetical protein [Caldanaerobius polysaccharolyticus]|uniref:hypothetical protein n=1 Tax=Caldanaerobius polysaccharolyticus TaxID=44256 RepID=UPI00047A6A2D|nr:hypothetical protein [Caldanaerobius polysaccharolyticus]
MSRKKNPYPVYSAVKFNTFEGGLSTEPPTTLEPNQLVQAKNVMLTLDGHVKPRPGMKKRFAQDFSNQPVNGIGVLYKSDRTSYLVMASGTALYKDKPHVIFEFDGQADWERTDVYTNLDTKSSPGDVKLYTPPQATFLGTATFDKMWI